MAIGPKDITAQARSLWDRLSRWQIITLAIVVIIGISIMVFFLARPRKANMTLLYTDLSVMDARYCRKLEGDAYPYELSEAELRSWFHLKTCMKQG